MTTSLAGFAEIDDIDGWLAAREAAFSDIRPGLAKEIVWTDSHAKNRTEIAIVYIHGFSASKGEVRPLPDRVAEALGANLFYTRLAGHGRTGNAMAQASLPDWQDDIAEALGIASRLGKKTLLIATSTGATLAAWALAQPDLKAQVAGAVFLSPNFGLKSRAAFLLTAPLASLTTRLILGRRHGFTPLNALHASHWTTDYPVAALLPMARLVRTVSALPFERIRVPALFVAPVNDQVVDASRTAAVARRWGGPARLIDPGAIGDPYGHVVAGDALSPETTDTVADTIVDWFKKIYESIDFK